MITRTRSGANFDFLLSMWIQLLTFSEHIHSPLLRWLHTPPPPHTEDTTKATRRHSWLIYTAAIQTRIAEDVWWFSNLASCHREMGRADPCHPHGASQTAPPSPSQSASPRYLCLPLCCPPALQMSGRMLCSGIPPPTSLGRGWPAPAAAWYNVMLSLGKGSTLICCVRCAAEWCMLPHNNRETLRYRAHYRRNWRSWWEIMR